LGEAVTLVNKQ